MAHAFLSPSGAPAWSRCLAKPWRERAFPNTSSDAANEGTAAHFLMEQCLIQGVDAEHFSGGIIEVNDTGARFFLGGNFKVGEEPIREVQKALDYIRGVSGDTPIMAEKTLPIAFITCEYFVRATGQRVWPSGIGFVDPETGEVFKREDVTSASGTVDALAITDTTADVFDLKYGRGVQVFAKENEQGLMYAAAALEEFDLTGEVETIRIHIVQPRLNHFDVWEISRAELDERIEALRQTSRVILAAPDGEGLPATTGDKQCKFCAAKAECPEYRNFVLEAVTEGFVDLDKGFVKVEMSQAEKLLANAFGVKPAAVTYHAWQQDDGTGAIVGEHFTVKKPNIRPALEAAELRLPDASDERLATLMDAADMIEGFSKAVRAEVERRLLQGKFTDQRYKLVEGRQGNRAWSSVETAETALKAMRLKVDQMYDFTLISPTKAEQLLSVANPRKWAKLQDLISRADGKPSVAPASDKRPALSIAIEDAFDALPEEPVIDNFEDLV